MNRLIYDDLVTPEFCDGVRVIAADLGVDPNWLMACMAFESGLNPAAKNPGSSASGLIQFMETTARSLGTTTAAIRKMSAVDQLPLVHRYFRPYKGRLKTLGDTYMAILYPAAIGKPDNFVLFAKNHKGGKAYFANRGLDRNKDGSVTKAEAAAKVYRHFDTGHIMLWIQKSSTHVSAKGIK